MSKVVLKSLSLLIALSLISVLLFTACAPSNQDSKETQPKETSSDTTEKSSDSSSSTSSSESSDSNKKYAGTKIEFNTIQVGEVDIIKQLIPEFEEKTGIKVEVVDLPWEAWQQSQLTGFMANSGKPDVVGGDQIWLGQYAESGYVLPLDDYIAKDADSIDVNDFPESLKQFTTWKGKTYYLPYLVSQSIMLYRKDLLEEMGVQPPKTLDEMLEVAKKFTKKYNPSSPTTYGLVHRYKQASFILADWITYLYSYGGQFFDDKNNFKPVFNSPEGIEAAEFFLNLYSKEKVVPEASINYEHDEVIRAFQTGEVPMLFAETYALSRVLDPNASKFTDQMVVTDIPAAKHKDGTFSSVPMLAGLGFAINKDSKDKDAAWEFIKFVMDKSMAKRRVLMNGTVARKSLLQDPEIAKQIPYLPVIERAFQSSKPRPNIPEWTEAEQIVGSALSEALVGKKTVKQALDDAAEKMDKLMKERGYYK